MNVIIITGTTKGLGKSFLESFLLDKNNIIISINRQKIISLDTKIINIKLDLANMSLYDIDNFESLLQNTCQNVDIDKLIFINNAFTMGELNKIDKLEITNIINSINTNFTSSFLLIQSFIKVAKEINSVIKILNISSGAAHKPIDGWSIYCSTKSAIEMYINNIQLEYPKYQCFNIDPGVINTNMQSMIRDFSNGQDNKYFINLYRKNHLKSASITANKIIKDYIL